MSFRLLARHLFSSGVPSGAGLQIGSVVGCRVGCDPRHPEESRSSATVRAGARCRVSSRLAVRSRNESWSSPGGPYLPDGSCSGMPTNVAISAVNRLGQPLAHRQVIHRGRLDPYEGRLVSGEGPFATRTCARTTRLLASSRFLSLRSLCNTEPYASCSRSSARGRKRGLSIFVPSDTTPKRPGPGPQTMRTASAASSRISDGPDLTANVAKYRLTRSSTTAHRIGGHHSASSSRTERADQPVRPRLTPTIQICAHK